jgi:1,4-alpha-glucan branching enzyme
MPGDAWNKSANLRGLLAYMWAHPGKQLLFQGGEFGQEREWSESRSIDWHLLDDPLHAGVKTLVKDLNRAYRANPALWTKDFTPEGFSWIDANDASGNVLSFLRHGVDADGKPTVLACIANFSGSPKRDYRVGLPFAGRWREVLNTDAQIYGGSGVGNLGAVEAERTMWHGRPASAVLQLPPAGVLWLVPEPGAGPVRRRAAASTTTTGTAPTDSPTGSVAEPDLAQNGVRPTATERATADPAPPDTASWNPAPWSSARTGDVPGDEADTGELPVVTDDMPPAEPVPTGEAVPDSPAPGTDSVLNDGPAAPVTEDAPDVAPPTPADAAAGSGGAVQSGGADAAAGSAASSGVDGPEEPGDRTDDDSSTAQ